MDIEVKKDKQYAAITVKSSTISQDQCEEIRKTVLELSEKGTRNFIINLKGVKEVSDGLYESLDAIMTALLKEEGMMVVTGCKGEIKTYIENKGIITTRTLDEAVDYVFMEEIEKQLQGGSDEDFDEL